MLCCSHADGCGGDQLPLPAALTLFAPHCFDTLTPRFSTLPRRFAFLLNNLAWLRVGTTLLLGIATVGMSAGPVAAQSITSFQPESGAAKTQVRLYGSDFDATAANSTVMFGGTKAILNSVKTKFSCAEASAQSRRLVTGPVTSAHTLEDRGFRGKWLRRQAVGRRLPGRGRVRSEEAFFRVARSAL